MAHEDEANRIPMLTIADYLWDPKEYEPNRSICQAVMHLGVTPEKREALRQLIELYPRRLWDSSTQTSWKSLRERFEYSPHTHSKDETMKLIARAHKTLAEMTALFPDRWSSGAIVLEQDVNAMIRQRSVFDSVGYPREASKEFLTYTLSSLFQGCAR